MSGPLLIENRGAVRILTLNRPEKMNALGGGLPQALAAALKEAAHDDSVAVIVLTGAGERAFCAGADLGEFRVMTKETRRDVIHHGDESLALQLLFGRIDKPIIAAVKGYVLGAGASLAIGSDMVIAGESAKFGYPELKRGIAATAVAAHVAHRIGQKVAFELLTLCENLDAHRAVALGLANRVVPDAEVLETAVGIANTMAGFPHDALWTTKRVFRRALLLDSEKALEMSRDAAVMNARLAT
jgi:enoyl-CoA hydratase/carnithine racemase